MQSLIIISLEKNVSELIGTLKEANYGSNLLENGSNEFMLIQKKMYYKLNFADNSVPGFSKMKVDFTNFFVDIDTDHREIKLDLLEYLDSSKGAVNLFCEKGFNQEGFNLASNLAKKFGGIILSGGVFVNSDHQVLLAFDGTSESSDFVGSPELVVEEKVEVKEKPKKPINPAIEKVRSLKLITNDKVPHITDIQDISFRDKAEICKRALALTFVASYAEGVIETNEIKEIRKFFLNMLKEYNVTSTLTETEMNFLYEYRPSKEQLIDFSWEYEGAYALMWCLGFVDDLSFPPEACAAHQLVNTIKQYPTFEEFVEASNLLNEKQLIEAYELAYRTQRAVNDTETTGRIMPGGIDLHVIKERNKAFQWLTKYRNGAAWDKLD